MAAAATAAAMVSQSLRSHIHGQHAQGTLYSTAAAPTTAAARSSCC